MLWAFFPSKLIFLCSKPLGKNWQRNCRNNSPFTLASLYILLQARYRCFSAFALRQGLQMFPSNALVVQRVALSFKSIDMWELLLSIQCLWRRRPESHWLLISEWSWYICLLLHSCGQPSIGFLNYDKGPAKAISFCSNMLAESNLCLLAAICSTDDRLAELQRRGFCCQTLKHLKF